MTEAEKRTITAATARLRQLVAVLPKPEHDDGHALYTAMHRVMDEAAKIQHTISHLHLARKIPAHRTTVDDLLS